MFYVMYAKLEEEYGLARHAMAVYDRACKTVFEEDRYIMCILIIRTKIEGVRNNTRITFFYVEKIYCTSAEPLSSLESHIHVRSSCAPRNPFQRNT